MKRILILSIITSMLFTSAFAYNNYEYIDIENMKSIEVRDNGYIAHLTDETMVYIDSYGNIANTEQEIIDGIYTNNDIIVTYKKENGVCGLLFPDGKTVETDYDELMMCGDNFKAKKGAIWYLIDKDLNVIHSFEGYDNFDIYDIRFFGMEIDDTTENAELLIIGEARIGEDIDGTYLFDKDFNFYKLTDKKPIKLQTYGDLIIFAEDDLSLKGVMDKEGHILYPAMNYIRFLGDGILSVTPVDAEGHIQHGDEIIVNNEGKEIATGLANVGNVGDNGLFSFEVWDNEHNYYSDDYEGYSGYMNNDGKVVIKLPKGYKAQTPFSEGLASVANNIVYAGYGKTSYINEEGRIILTQDSSDTNSWTMGRPFKNGVTAIGVGLGKAGCLGNLLVKYNYTGDKPSDWAKGYVGTANEKGIVPEHLNNYYNTPITREEFCDLAYKTLESLGKTGEKELKNPFKDTENENVVFLSSIGIINGTSENKFSPSNPILREQAAAILYRMAKYLDVDMPNIDGKNINDYYEGLQSGNYYSTYYIDTYVSEYAKVPIMALNEMKIMMGVSDGIFAPQDSYTVEQAVTTMLRLVECK